MKVNRNKLKKIQDSTFVGMFESLQLLGFTVLYYNFNYSTEKMKKFNAIMHEINSNLLKSEELYDKTKEDVSKIWGTTIEDKVKEFPYRAKVGIMGGLPKGGMQYITRALDSTCIALESYLILSFASMKQLDSKLSPVQMDCFYQNLKDNAMNYANGMKDEFIVKYFEDEIDLTLRKSS